MLGAFCERVVKCNVPVSCEIDKLIDNDEMSSADLLPEAAAGGRGNNMCDPLFF